VTIISRLIEGTFIDYNPLISTDTATTTCIVDVNRIRDAEQRCSVLDNSVTLLLNFDNEIELKTNSSTGRVAETITPLECQIDGEPVMIGFNPVLLDSTLNALSKRGNIKISMTGSNNPAIVTADGDDTEIHLIVPMRISK
jgi:DNA polymerase III sliding clamp (beta) subunit (PCNA family)